MQVAVEHAEERDAHRASGSGSADSSGSFIDVGGSTADIGEDAGGVVEAGDWGGGGDGALSSGTGVRSANVSAVEDSPAHSLGMSPSRMRRLVYATFYERTKAAKFDANEGLDPVAIDFLGQVGVPINRADFVCNQINNAVPVFRNVSAYIREISYSLLKASYLGMAGVNAFLGVLWREGESNGSGFPHW